MKASARDEKASGAAPVPDRSVESEPGVGQPAGMLLPLGGLSVGSAVRRAAGTGDADPLGGTSHSAERARGAAPQPGLGRAATRRPECQRERDVGSRPVAGAGARRRRGRRTDPFGAGGGLHPRARHLLLGRLLPPGPARRPAADRPRTRPHRPAGLRKRRHHRPCGRPGRSRRRPGGRRGAVGTAPAGGPGRAGTGTGDRTRTATSIPAARTRRSCAGCRARPARCAG